MIETGSQDAHPRPSATNPSAAVTPTRTTFTRFLP